MASSSLRLLQALAFAACLNLPTIAQNSTPQNSTLQSQSQHAVNPVTPSDYTVRTYTRLVNLEVVVKDSKGNHIQGLKPEDFLIDEQTPAKSGKWSGQKIAEFREVHTASLAMPLEMQAKMPPGAYTNALTVGQDPVPPTVILVDGLNTPVEIQPQVHVQMLKMLHQLPPNVPVAVFLLGDRLTLLQSFTTNPKLLEAALEKAHSTAGYGLQQGDPRDDSNSISNLLTRVGGTRAADMVAALAAFDQKIYSGSLGDVAGRTMHALGSLGENLSGYPGRKNLLWLSTSFPISLSMVESVGVASGQDDWAEIPNYSQDVQHLTRVLSDAKVAVYPVNMAGVQTYKLFQAGARLAVPAPQIEGIGTGFTGPASQSTASLMADSRSRDVMTQNAAVDTMQDLAEGTGGIVCTGDNDLGDCVRKAVDDSSDFYEISYYSDSPDWNGEFRKVEVKTPQRGARLSYRTGYFATPEGNPDSRIQSAELQSDCDDFLDATSVTFTAYNVASVWPGDLTFQLSVDPESVVFPMDDRGDRQLHLDVAVCTYNGKDWPQKLMNYPITIKLTAKQFSGLMTSGKLTDTIRIPGPKPAALRLMVKDVSTGKLGSVYIKTRNMALAATPIEDKDATTVFQ